MSAAPHLIQRVRRWWHLQLLNAREAQLAGLIAQIERGMAADAGELATLRMHLIDTRQRLVRAGHRTDRYLETTACR
jgi:hypothetical protein